MNGATSRRVSAPETRVVIPERVRLRILAEVAAQLNRLPYSIAHESTPFPQLMRDGRRADLLTEALRHLPRDMWEWWE